MTPAVRTAAAFLYATGDMPKGVHMETHGAVSRIAPYTPGVRQVCGVSLGGYVIGAEHLDAIRQDPLAQSHDFLKGCGFRVTHDRRRSTRSIAYLHPDSGVEAHSWRGGGGSIWVRRHSVPYQVSLGFTGEAVAAFLASHPGAWPPSVWTTWNALAVELTAAGGVNRPSLYSEADALTWHAAGRDPIAYAVDAVRRHYRDS